MYARHSRRCSYVYLLIAISIGIWFLSLYTTCRCCEPTNVQNISYPEIITPLEWKSVDIRRMYHHLMILLATCYVNSQPSQVLPDNITVLNVCTIILSTSCLNTKKTSASSLLPTREHTRQKKEIMAHTLHNCSRHYIAWLLAIIQIFRCRRNWQHADQATFQNRISSYIISCVENAK